MEMERKSIIEVLATIFPNQIIDIGDDDSFIDKFGMDSILFVSYVIEIEGKFGIEVPDEYSLPSKLDTLNKTYDLLRRKRG